MTLPSIVLGRFVTLRATRTTHYFDDATAPGGSDIAGETFGTTPGVAWPYPRPVFIYAINIDDTDEGLEFMLTANPRAEITTNSFFYGYRAHPSPPGALPADYDNFVLTGSGDLVDGQKPVVLLGFIRMTKNAADDWTVLPFGFNHDGGLGVSADGNIYEMPTGQHGAAPGSYFLPSGGAAPVFGTDDTRFGYTINRDGTVELMITLLQDGGTDGTGGQARLMMPFPFQRGFLTNYSGAGLLSVTTGGVAHAFHATPILIFSSSRQMGLSVPNTASIGGNTVLLDSVRQISNSDFGNGDRELRVTFRYRAF